MKQRSAQFLRKRKFYLVLPLLALPFITLAFWSMGGGKVQETIKTETGLNLNLPDASLKDEKNFDKLSFYNQAEKDSLKYEEALRNDPNYKPDTGMNVLQMIHQPNPMITSPYSNHGMDANEQKIYKKINELNSQINAPVIQAPPKKQDPTFSKEVDKLQDMMQVMTDKQEDPEIQQINGVLDKILEIQHPKVKEKSIQQKEKVFSVNGAVKNEVISLLSDTIKQRKIHNDFYELDNKLANETNQDHAIEAVVHQEQTVVSGSTIKLRLTNDIYINGILIPKGNFIYGTAALENERLAITIKAIRYQNNLLPVALEVYDLDGIAGIHIPGAISREVAKQSAEQSLQGLDVTMLDPSITAQAANTGIQAARSLLSRKAKLLKATLKAGYKVLLKNKN